MWNIFEKEKYTLYVNKFIDLKIKVYEENNKSKIYINYKGYNVAFSMFIWEFGEYLNLKSIDNYSLEGGNIKDIYY